MQKLIIATLATATLGKNIAVQNMLKQHTGALEHVPKGPSSAPDQARIKMDLGADGERWPLSLCAHGCWSATRHDCNLESLRTSCSFGG